LSDDSLGPWLRIRGTRMNNTGKCRYGAKTDRYDWFGISRNRSRSGGPRAPGPLQFIVRFVRSVAKVREVQ